MFFEYNELAFVATWKFSKNAGAHDAGVVKDHKVAWLKKIYQVGIVRIGYIAGIAIKNKKTGSAANLRWVFGDVFLWKIVIVV